ncbi:MAG: VWA domain-containing protein [Lachnospiraceae bacterium]
MNIFLQLGIGLGAAALIVWLCQLFRKQKRWWGFVYAGAVTAACVAAVALGVLKRSPEKEAAAVPLSQEEWITFAYAFAQEGSYEEVFELIDGYSDRYGYDDECSLLTARTYALQGKYEAADGIYRRLAQAENYEALIDAEYSYIEKKCGAGAADLSMVRYLEKNGKDPEEYGYAADAIGALEADSRITQETISEAVFAAVKEEYKTKQFEKEVSYVKQAEAYYDKYAAQGPERLNEEEQNAIKEVRKELKKLKEKGKGVSLTGCVREALLRVNLLLGDYDAIAGNIDEYATYTELVIASELYMGEAVSKKNFAEAYTSEYGEKAVIVGEQLKAIYESEKEGLGKAEAEELELLVKFWKTGLKHPVLTKIKSGLERELNGNPAGCDASKVHLAIAKIEHFYENEKSRTGNITEAVNSGHASEDDEYSDAMNKIYQVIHSSEDTEEILNVPRYVEQALDRAMPMEVYDLLPWGEAEGGLGLYALPSEEMSIWEGESSEPEPEKESEKAVKKEFSQVFVEYVSEVKSTVSIGYIDTAEFETVKADLVISSEYAKNSKELKEILSVYDCGLEITDFTIEKVEYDSIRTHLICDVSGSMAGSIYDLREAVTKYINGKSAEEQIALSSFSNYIEGTVPFGSEDSALLKFAEAMYASGGTAIYRTLTEVLGAFETAQNSNNIVILMTDGEDGYPASYDTIKTELAALADAKNVTIYTLGLGQVDTAYLSAIARSGRGDFVYVSDSGSLDNFYELLHSQVDNRYILTYKATDTLTGVDRTLEVKLSDGNAFDEKTYSILDEEEAGTDGTQGPDLGRVFLRGLGVRCIYKGNQATKNTLLGSGFTPEGRAVIRLLGDMDYTMELTYVNETTYDFTVPAEVAVGVYDVEVSLGGKKAVLRNGLSVADARTESQVTFGPYVFTAAQCIENYDGSKTLRGNVRLNDWLKFKGEVTLEENPEEDTTIRVTDYSGSYVTFDANSAIGLGKYFANKGIAMDVPALNKFELYYDGNHLYDFDEYDVAEIRTPFLSVMQLVRFNSPFIKLYPDRIEIKYSATEPHLPFQDVIFHSNGEKEFEVTCEGSAILNQKNLGILLKVSSEGENKNYKQFQLFKAPVYLSADDLKLSIDTFKEEYAFGALVKFAFLDFGMGADVTFKGFTPDKFTLTVDKDVNTTMGGIPLTFSKFKFGAEDIEPALKNRDFAQLKIVGGLDIAAAKVSAFFPKLKKFVGDISVLSMPETKMELDLSPLAFSAEAKLNFLETIKLLEAQLKIGTFEYSSELLELDSATVSGLMAALKAGIDWELEDCKVDISAVGELDALSRFFGVQLRDARVLVDVKWWLFSKHIEKEADALLGLYFKENGDPQFTLALGYYDKKGKREKLCLYIDKNGKTGKKSGSFK